MSETYPIANRPSSQKSATRRFFLGAATAASAARVAGAQSRIRIGVIGTGPRGQYLMKQLQKIGGVEFPAVCDVYDLRRNQAAQIAGPGAETYGDHRALVERTDLDAVIVATPDHWHGPITVDALRAGKDVYVEKPMVHNPRTDSRSSAPPAPTNASSRSACRAAASPSSSKPRRPLHRHRHHRQNRTRPHLVHLQPGLHPATAPRHGPQTRRPRLGPLARTRPQSPLEPQHLLQPLQMAPLRRRHDHGHRHPRHRLRPPLARPERTRLRRRRRRHSFYDDGRDTPDTVAFILEYPQKLTLTFEAECLTAPGLKPPPASN
jgi:hypothetical protein